MATVKENIFNQLDEEAHKAGLSRAEFVRVLDASARPKIGQAYAYGTIVAALTTTYNKETALRVIRAWKQKYRISE